MTHDAPELVAVGTRLLSELLTNTQEFMVGQADELNELHGGMLAGHATRHLGCCDK